MGYYVEITESNFMLIKLFHKPALDAINAYWQADLHRSYPTMSYKPSQDLTAALEAMGYTPGFNDRGDIVDITFDGKYRSDEPLWSVLAPYVEDSSSLDFRGEDGGEWRLLFHNGKLFEQDSVKTWLEPYEISKTDLTEGQAS